MTVAISVDLQRASDADKIHKELFGDGLPNYDSSFFGSIGTSNHAIELIASCRIIPLRMSSTRQSSATRAPARASSPWSR